MFKILILILSTSVSCTYLPRNLDRHDLWIGSELVTQEHSTNEFKQIYKKNAEYLIVQGQRNFSQDAAIQKVSYIRNYLNELYKQTVEPYFGKAEITKPCPLLEEVKAEKIAEFDTSFIIRFKLPATKNYLYGSCRADLMPMSSQYTLIYCKKSGLLIQLRYFFPKENVPTLQINEICSKF